MGDRRGHATQAIGPFRIGAGAEKPRDAAHGAGGYLRARMSAPWPKNRPWRATRRLG
jgi:hypothetical protein